MEFKGMARRLTSLDIARLAHTIGCGEDHLHAVMEVETRGGGFDRHGRIKMLFEPHIFYRELAGAEREEAIAAGLAYRRWGEKRYPRDSYPRLERAMAINAEAALRSCSWGLGQIMGFNHRAAGYGTVTAMVEAFRDDEDTHLAAMVEFIVSSGLDDELRREDWRGFARGYNGAGYAKHGYHTKLKRAFDKWQAIPDTPFTPDDIDRSEPEPNPPADPILATRGMVLRLGMRGPDVRNLQGILNDLGYHCGKADGQFGRLVKAAVVAFQSENGLVADGEVGELTWAALNRAPARPKRDHDEKSLAASGSSIIKNARKAEKALTTTEAVAGTGLTLGGMIELSAAASRAEGALEVGQRLLLNYWPIILMGVGVVIASRYGKRIVRAIKQARVDDAITGRNLGR
jgi:hypothetical protein